MRSHRLSPPLCLCWLLLDACRAAYYQDSYFVNQCCQTLLNEGLTLEEANARNEQVRRPPRRCMPPLVTA